MFSQAGQSMSPSSFRASASVMAEISSTIGSRRPTYDLTSWLSRQRTPGHGIFGRLSLQHSALRLDLGLRFHIRIIYGRPMQDRCTTVGADRRASDGSSLVD